MNVERARATLAAQCSGLDDRIGRVDSALVDAFGLDPDVLHLNHGAFGVAPVAVRRAAAAWRDRAERNPHRFNRVEVPGLIARPVSHQGESIGGVGDVASASGDEEDGVREVVSARPGRELVVAGLQLGQRQLAVAGGVERHLLRREVQKDGKHPGPLCLGRRLQEKLVADGATEITGPMPINTDGGLIANGEPMGASGLRQLNELVLQLRGQAGDRQVEGNPRVGYAQVYGAPGTAAVTIRSSSSGTKRRWNAMP